MPVLPVLGAQWGDEGKGKIVDYLSQEADAVVRFNGGPNAGHTVKNKKGEFKLHLVPSGIFYPKTICVIGNGVAVDPEILIKEMEELERKGVSCGNLKISGKAHIIMPWHPIVDALQESDRQDHKIGTTKKGMGPVFADKAYRYGFRMGDFLREGKIRQKLENSGLRVKEQIKMFFADLDYHKGLPENFDIYGDCLSPYIADTESLLRDMAQEGRNILLEGAQGALLDVDFGTYPDVTSSPCTAAGACQGSGITPNRIDQVLGVAKAYVTRVGSDKQSLPTEMPPDLASWLRQRASEYGATTGRPRRIGWMDLVLLKYAARMNGFTQLALTRIDSLAGLDRVKVCFAYRTPQGELVSDRIDLEDLREMQPCYIDLPGWKKFPKKCRGMYDFPKEALNYISVVEEEVGVPIKLVSFGAERDKIATKDR